MTENVWENFLGLPVSVHSLLVEGGAQDKVLFMALGFADHPCHGRASLVAQLVKNLPAMKDDPGLIPGLGRSPGEGIDYPLQYSCLENPQGQRSLAGYSPRGHKELDTT